MCWGFQVAVLLLKFKFCLGQGWSDPGLQAKSAPCAVSSALSDCLWVPRESCTWGLIPGRGSAGPLEPDPHAWDWVEAVQAPGAQSWCAGSSLAHRAALHPSSGLLGQMVERPFPRCSVLERLDLDLCRRGWIFPCLPTIEGFIAYSPTPASFGGTRSSHSLEVG